MISRYGIFCKIIETGSFTKTAELLGYSQSAVSQTIKALERGQRSLTGERTERC